MDSPKIIPISIADILFLSTPCYGFTTPLESPRRASGSSWPFNSMLWIRDDEATRRMEKRDFQLHVMDSKLSPARAGLLK